MFPLFTTNPGGSQEIELVEQVPAREWEALRRMAIRLMKARLCPPGSIAHLEETPYELWRGTNGFGDEFELLCYKADIERYTEIERENDHNQYLHDYAYPDIADSMEKIGRPIRFIAVEMDTTDNVQSVPAPQQLEITSETVDAALADAETLIRTSGPANAVDRACTALQAYLEQICEREGISIAANTNLPTLLGQIRQAHPKLQNVDPLVEQMTVQILRGMAQVVDALNTARNKKTLAHPNPLLDEPEAMLAINAIRTVLHYFDKRLR